MGFTFFANGNYTNTLSVPGGYQVLYDSGLGIVEANPENGPTATVKYHLNNSQDRYSFVQQLLGLWTGTPPNNITYIGPFVYPPSPNLCCTAVTDVRTVGKWVPMNITSALGLIGLPYMFGKDCVVTAVFTRPPWQAATNQGYFSIGWNAGGESFNVPETVYRFGDGTPTTIPLSFWLVHAQVTVTRYRMPFIPDAYAASLLNTVNNAPFAIGWNVYNTGTLMFFGMNTEVESDPLGNITYQCQYVFKFRNIPWNYAFHPNRTTGFAPVTDGNGNPPFTPANFTILP